MIMSEHISDERLAQYSEGRLVEPQLGEVEEHLLICEQCCARLTVFDDNWGSTAEASCYPAYKTSTRKSAYVTFDAISSRNSSLNASCRSSKKASTPP